MKKKTTASSSTLLSLFLLALVDVSHGFMVVTPFHVSPMTRSKNPAAAGGTGGQCIKPYSGVGPLYSDDEKEGESFVFRPFGILGISKISGSFLEGAPKFNFAIVDDDEEELIINIGPKSLFGDEDKIIRTETISVSQGVEKLTVTLFEDKGTSSRPKFRFTPLTTSGVLVDEARKGRITFIGKSDEFDRFRRFESPFSSEEAGRTRFRDDWEELSFVVYDFNRGRLIDSVTFDVRKKIPVQANVEFNGSDAVISYFDGRGKFADSEVVASETVRLGDDVKEVTFSVFDDIGNNIVDSDLPPIIKFEVGPKASFLTRLKRVFRPNSTAGSVADFLPPIEEVAPEQPTTLIESFIFGQDQDFLLEEVINFNFSFVGAGPDELIIEAGDDKRGNNDFLTKSKTIPLSGQKNVKINLFEPFVPDENEPSLPEGFQGATSFSVDGPKKASISYYAGLDDPNIASLVSTETGRLRDDLEELTFDTDGVGGNTIERVTFDVGPKKPRPLTLFFDQGLGSPDAGISFNSNRIDSCSSTSTIGARSTVVSTDTRVLRLEGDVKEVTFRLLDILGSNNVDNDLPPIVTLDVGPKPSFLTRLKRIFRGN